MRVERLYISDEHNFFGHHGKPAGQSPVREVDEVECVAGRGLKGDRFFDHKEDYKGQVTFFSQEVYRDLLRQFDVDPEKKTPAVFRRNVLISGTDLNALIGEEFELQGVHFAGSEESSPCYWMNQAFAEGAEEALKGRGGLRARILSDGILRRDSHAG